MFNKSHGSSEVYCTNSQAQFHDFGVRLEAKQNQLDVIVMGIKSVLDIIDLVPAMPKSYGLGDRPPRSNMIVERCEAALMRFKLHAHNIACSTIGHALVVVVDVC